MAAGPRFRFSPFELDAARRRLTKDGEPLALSTRSVDVLLALVARAGQIVSKEDLLEAGWKDVAVGDNSLEQAISSLRRVLGPSPQGGPSIETAARRGYRFAVPVERLVTREADDRLDELLAPHRSFLEGRAALETLTAAQVARAQAVFEDARQRVPDHPSAHIGLAAARLLRFEMTRADVEPDRGALATAVEHAREACRLDPASAEAWATLGVVLDRLNDPRSPLDGPAALKYAVTLEPENWRHHFRLASVTWGEARLGAAHRALQLLPGFPLARWLAATVYVARQLPEDAVRELTTGLAEQPPESSATPFAPVALHWLLGLLALARGDEDGARESFARELEAEKAGHLYGREVCANSWYALGALELRLDRRVEAAAAFNEALTRAPRHPMARTGLALCDRRPGLDAIARAAASVPNWSVDAAICQAAFFAFNGAHEPAAETVDRALAGAPAGNAGWLLPIEPLLQVSSAPDVWARPLARLRSRAM